MNKILSIVAALLAGASYVSAQSNALVYYQKINKAELAICDSNLKAANQYYREAFKINPDKPFSQDLSNAFFAAIDTHEYPLAEQYLSRLLSRGLGSKYINKKILGSYKGEQRQFIESLLVKYPNDTVLTNPLAIRIRQMLDWDQDVRKYFGSQKNNAYMVDSTYEVDYTNAKELLQLFQKNGIPNEDVVGNGGYGDFSPQSLPDYCILIMHHNGGELGNKPSRFFDTMLLNAVYSWDFDPRSFLSTVHESPKVKKLQSGNIIIHFPMTTRGCYYDGLIYPEYWEPATEERMNADRAKLGLCSLDDVRTKIAAENNGISKGGFISKYSLMEGIGVQDVFSEEELKEWVAKNGTPKKIQ